MTASLVYLLLAMQTDDPAAAAGAANPHEAVGTVGAYWLDTSRNCGTLCLSFLDRKFMGKRTYAEVASLCPPGQEGTNLAQLQTAARKLGYHALPFQAPLERLTRLRHPALVRYLWADDRALLERDLVNDHFVVILDWNRVAHEFHVFDPPKSLSWIPYREVARHYAGMGLVVSNQPLPPLDELLEPGPRWPLAAAAAAWALFVDRPPILLVAGDQHRCCS
jgi:ABC-type bacteriocin/lantibiotic exporter with double-glycine peptidase domain